MRTHLAVLAAFGLAAPPVLAAPPQTVIYSFGQTPTDASGPNDGVIRDKTGAFVGTTPNGGAHGLGTVFRVDAQGTETVLYSFLGGTDGAVPEAGLAMDSRGDLFGTTTTGGTHDKGTVFELVPNGTSYTETVIYRFCAKTNCADGAMPVAGIVIDTGVLFGTTQTGGAGANNGLDGVVWRLDPPDKHLHETAWKETVLHNFCGLPSCTDGRRPYTSPLVSNHTLYGTTSQSDHGGTLYRLDENGTTFTALCDFGLKNGDPEAPIAAPSIDRAGVLYGTTRLGGLHNYGTVYSVDTKNANPVCTAIHSFTANDGSVPNAGVTLVLSKSPPVLYGTTATGGDGDHGVLYRLTNVGGVWKIKSSSFCPTSGCAAGAAPGYGAPLIVDRVLYGTTSLGGAFRAGVLYRVSP